MAAAACIAIVNVGCGDDEDASARGSGDAPSGTEAREPSPSPSPPSGGDAGAEGDERGRLPFSFSRPRGFLRGRAPEPIVASLLVDRRNAILISRFGGGAPTGAQLREAIQRKLTEAGVDARVTLERQPSGLELVATNLSEFRTTDQVAGRPVDARRLYFSAGNTIWEVNCQYTRQGRERVLAGCAHVASSLRPR
jgi:hypothetical protein